MLKNLQKTSSAGSHVFIQNAFGKQEIAKLLIIIDSHYFKLSNYEFIVFFDPKYVGMATEMKCVAALVPKIMTKMGF